ncbi:MAG TPA: M48 family metalloprotease, partial [Candidatus Nitrosotalea sp.]|nr:M48 family metalloprotease [Candidatus Nitrosotalea sp.]
MPETGRHQINLISAGEETKLGLSSFDQMKKETPINKNPSANALVQKVGKSIAPVAPLPNAQWEFVVFESKEANAFCMPGRKVGVYTGILAITKDEAGWQRRSDTPSLPTARKTVRRFRCAGRGQHTRDLPNSSYGQEAHRTDRSLVAQGQAAIPT